MNCVRAQTCHPETMGCDILILGKNGESKATELIFDIAHWRAGYPAAEIQLYVSPPAGDGYFAVLEERESSVAWTVTSADTAHSGRGEIELILRDVQTGTTLKSATARTLVKSSPSHAEGGEPPEVHKPWWEKLLGMLRGFVRSVNGVMPDENGNVTIEVGGEGTVKSVNGVKPDEDGNVKIDTGTEGSVTSVNGVKPDEDGNVQIEVGSECECEAATDDEVVEALFAMGALPAITDENGAILTDENNAILMI